MSPAISMVRIQNAQARVNVLYQGCRRPPNLTPSMLSVRLRLGYSVAPVTERQRLPSSSGVLSDNQTRRFRQKMTLHVHQQHDFQGHNFNWRPLVCQIVTLSNPLVQCFRLKPRPILLSNSTYRRTYKNRLDGCRVMYDIEMSGSWLLKRHITALALAYFATIFPINFALDLRKNSTSYRSRVCIACRLYNNKWSHYNVIEAHIWNTK